MKKIIFLFFLIKITLLAACTAPTAAPTVTAITSDGALTMSDGSSVAIPHYADPAWMVVYMVRHCDKKQGEGSDPDLSAEGQARAERLGRVFDRARIDRIAYTNTKRTTQTALVVKRWAGDPDYTNFPPELSLEWLTETMQTDGAGKKLVYVGHSNTIPQMLNALTNSVQYQNIADQEYGMLYVVATHGVGQTEVLEMRY
jgi:2,3-bisphosphoglycerate-dependent phosphoglycerate mutase